MIGIILAAGNGMRLKSSTGVDCCKALRKINDMHLIEFALNNVLALGLEKVCIVIGQQGDLIKEAIGNEYKGMHVTYARQEEQKGLINALVCGINEIDDGEDIVLQLADEILTGLKTADIRNAVSTMDKDFYCGVTYESNPKKIKNNFSVEVDKNFNMISCKEKPTEIINDIKGTGFCIFSKNAVQMLKDMYNESTNIPNDLCDYMNTLISEGKQGAALFVAEKEFNINTAFDLEEVLVYINDKA